MDLFVATVQASNILYRNDGNGNFVDVTSRARVGGAATTISNNVLWFDLTGDGLLDIFVTNEDARNDFFRNNGDGTFTDVTVAAGLGGNVATAHGVASAVADVDNDGDGDLFISFFNAANVLFRNDGAGRFTDISAPTRVAGDPLAQSTGVAFADYDQVLNEYL